MTRRAAAGFFELTEMQCEAELLFVRQRLIAKYQHSAFGHAGMDRRDLVGRQLLPAVDTRDFASECGGKPPDRYGQRSPFAIQTGTTGTASERTISTDPGTSNEGRLGWHRPSLRRPA